MSDTVWHRVNAYLDTRENEVGKREADAAVVDCAYGEHDTAFITVGDLRELVRLAELGAFIGRETA